MSNETARKRPPQVQAFIDDIVAVYEKHDMSLSHEDPQGAFIIEPLMDCNVNSLHEAFHDVALVDGIEQ